MPRYPRSYIKTSYFHIMVQGINKSKIFENSEEKKYYIKLMYSIKKEYNIKIKAYCVMDNHTHMLLNVKEIKDLSSFMHKVNTRYAQYYNKKYTRVGYVFRDRYKSQGIYSEQQLYSCIKYIHDNPVKAKICEKPEEYRYSSYQQSMEKSLEYGTYNFIDIDNENDIKDLLEDFLVDNDISIEELKKDNRKLRALLIVLKGEYDISIRKISAELNVGRERLRNLYRA